MGRIGTRRLLIGALIVGAVAVASASAVVFEGRDDSGSDAAVRSGSATSSTSTSTTSTSTSTSTTSTSTTTTTTTTVAPTTAPPEPTTQAPAPAPQCNSSTNGEIDAMNADRSAAGLAPVCSNGALAAYAQRWATWMAQNQSLTHQDLQNLLGGTGFSTVGENILEGPGSMTPAQMEVAWMNSPPHRQNILSGAYTAAGVGTATDSTGQIWVVVDFGG